RRQGHRVALHRDGLVRAVLLVDAARLPAPRRHQRRRQPVRELAHPGAPRPLSEAPRVRPAEGAARRGRQRLPRQRRDHGPVVLAREGRPRRRRPPRPPLHLHERPRRDSGAPALRDRAGRAHARRRGRLRPRRGQARGLRGVRRTGRDRGDPAARDQALGPAARQGDRGDGPVPDDAARRAGDLRAVGAHPRPPRCGARPALRRSPRAPMRRLLVLALVLAVATVGLAAAAPAWRRLPPAPLPAGPGARGTTDAVAVWTGKEMLVFARAHPNPPWSVDVSAAYDPARRTWRRLEPLAGPPGNYEGSYAAVWTGRELLVFGPADNQGYTPATNRWRRLRNGGSGPGEVLAWTGREVLTWGGGCCGDASNAGAAFDPATNTWRPLPASPLAPSQRPQGAWTGSELVVLVSGLDPNGEPYPARD